MASPNSKAASEMKLLISLVKKVDQTNDVLSQIRRMERGTQRAASSTQRLTRETRALSRESMTASRSIGGLGAGLQTFGLGGGLAAGGGIYMLVRALRTAVATGVEWNSTIEQTRIGLTILLGSAEKAEARLNELKKFAAFTPFELPEITKTDRILENMTRGALAGAEGLRLAGDAAAGTNNELQATAFWMARLYAGLKSGTAIGEVTLRMVEMGLVTGEQKQLLEELAKSARSSNEVIGILEDTFGRTSGAMELQSKAMEGLWSTMKDTFGAATGDSYKWVFDSLKVSMQTLLELFGVFDSESEQLVKNLEQRFRDLQARVSTATAATVASVQGDLATGYSELLAEIDRQTSLTLADPSNLQTLQNLNLLASRYRFLMASAGVDSLSPSIEQLQGQLESLRAEQRELYDLQRLMSTQATDQELAAWQRELSAVEKGIANVNDQLVPLLARRKAMETTGGTAVSAESLAENERTAQLEQARKLEEEYATVVIDRRSEIERITGRILELERERDALLANPSVEDETRAKIEFDFEQKIAAEKEKQAKAQAAIDKRDQEQKDAQLTALRTQIDAEKKLTDAQLDQLEVQIALLEADPFTPSFEKFPTLLQYYQDQIGLIDELIIKLQALAAANPDSPELQQLIEGRIDGLQSRRNDATKETQAVDPNSFSEQLKSKFNDLEESWGSVEEMIAGGITGTIQRAVDSLSDSIMGLIDGTATWGDLFRNVGREVVASLIRIGVQMLVMAAIRKASNTQQIAEETAKTPALMANATAASVSSFGVAAGLGLAALLAVMAIAASGSWATGGYTGPGGVYEPAGLVHRGEVVWSQRDVARVGGPAMAEQIRLGRALPQFAAGGYVGTAPAPAVSSGSAGNASGAQSVSIAIRTSPHESQLRDWLESQSGRKLLLDAMRDQQYQV